jgi:hypothetical protein
MLIIPGRLQPKTWSKHFEFDGETWVFARFNRNGAPDISKWHDKTRPVPKGYGALSPEAVIPRLSWPLRSLGPAPRRISLCGQFENGPFHSIDLHHYWALTLLSHGIA